MTSSLNTILHIMTLNCIIIDDEPLALDLLESYVANAKDMNDALINTFVTALENRLEDFAAEHGIKILSLDTDLYVDDEYCINIHKITVAIENCRLYDIEELSREISEELGIPVDVTEE